MLNIEYPIMNIEVNFILFYLLEHMNTLTR